LPFILLLLLYRPRSSQCRCLYKLGHDQIEWSKKFDRQLFSRSLRINFVMADDATMRPLLIGSAGTYLGCLNWPQKTTRYCRVRRKLFYRIGVRVSTQSIPPPPDIQMQRDREKGSISDELLVRHHVKTHRPAVE
jgi:hypothetical protein